MRRTHRELEILASDLFDAMQSYWKLDPRKYGGFWEQFNVEGRNGIRRDTKILMFGGLQPIGMALVDCEDGTAEFSLSLFQGGRYVSWHWTYTSEDGGRWRETSGR